MSLIPELSDVSSTFRYFWVTIKNTIIILYKLYVQIPSSKEFDEVEKTPKLFPLKSVFPVDPV